MTTDRTIEWKTYSEAQKAAALGYAKKTAPGRDMNACFALAAKSAITSGRTAYIVATYYGPTISDQPPAPGQSGFVFEAERYGKIG